MSLFVSNN